MPRCVANQLKVCARWSPAGDEVEDSLVNRGEEQMLVKAAIFGFL
jgi:hypothetical protein